MMAHGNIRRRGYLAFLFGGVFLLSTAVGRCTECSVETQFVLGAVIVGILVAGAVVAGG